ncbi:DEAD/DEAH box helicase [Brachybacterium aquaticum]|uniref:DNA helicase n=1 Tax=Brachybacterium aquaticum TaxID=1432564 RepID=A0A841AHE4_9MICO|nr:AAA domain-containing protein [Brachybacterium aquaticum]MBB5832494.1 hypothetical protein [Brachybacterium aquaticum]
MGTGRVDEVTDYFAQVLRRGQLEEVTFTDASPFVVAPREQITEGALDEEDTAALFAHHDRMAPKSKGGKARRDPTISVVISLATLPADRGGTQHGLLLLSATLHRDGRLEPDLESSTSPWIPSERPSSPAVTDREVMVGSLHDFWAHTRTEVAAEISRTETMRGAVRLAETLFRAVSGTTLEDFAAENADLSREITLSRCCVQELDRFNAVGGLLQLYDFYERTGNGTALLTRAVQGWQGTRAEEMRIHDGDGLLEAARAACGSMSDGFPLTASQRRAVHAFLGSEDGEVTAVSGPPGTGKTTVLQSIVANLLTRRALDRGAAPVIVGTSTNNQAVTNIISSFSSVTKREPGTLDLRWLPEASDGSATAHPLRSLAVYCPAKYKLDEAKKQFLVEQKERSGAYADYTQDTYLAAARNHFLRQVHQHFGSIAEPSEVQGWIHEALTEVDGYRIALLETMSRQGPSAAYARLCDRLATSEHLRGQDLDAVRAAETLEALDEVLDRTLRYAEFWLAVHFFEAQWLLTDDFLEEKERFKTTRDAVDRYWPQAAALTPCFVMTVYQVPRYFGLWTKEEEPPRFDAGRIDLLVVDEAGQVDTPLGLPILGLARRAVVVGDEKQLSPVWSLDEETDREMARGAGIPEHTWREDLRERGLTCSAGSSLMRVASHASRWTYGEAMPGLLLREHFRCHPDIIGFCNELLYGGLLEPKRPPASSKLHGLRPAFEWVDVPQSQDARQGSSRVNQVEARTIARWIVENYGSLFDLYHHQEPDLNKKVPDAELIGVVTPFAAQARLILKEIRLAVQEAGPDADLPGGLAQKITVGTAHRLQGAERPVILFSAVYGTASSQAGFIDATPELMNVAVSRAKDHLVVFAAPNRWDSGPVFGTMAQFARRAAPSETSPPDLEDEPAPPAVLEPVPRTAEEPTEHEEPTEDEVPLRSLTAVIQSWDDAGHLTAEDADLKAASLNPRLAAIGLLAGEPKHWRPTPLAALLGVVETERTGAGGKHYTSIECTGPAQELLLALYRGGNL